MWHKYPGFPTQLALKARQLHSKHLVNLDPRLMPSTSTNFKQYPTLLVFSLVDFYTPDSQFAFHLVIWYTISQLCLIKSSTKQGQDPQPFDWQVEPIHQNKIELHVNPKAMV